MNTRAEWMMDRQNYKKEEKWGIWYAVPTAEGNWNEKYCRVNSKEKKDANIQKIKELGYKFISCKKLYPFSTNKNQHNFELINNICYNTMWDMDHNEIPYDNAEYNRLYDLRQKAEKYFCYELPVAWVPYEELVEMKEISNMAIMHRQDACIANGRPDLVTYC